MIGAPPRPSRVLGAAADVSCSRLPATSLNDEIAADVARAAFPGYAEQLLGPLTDRAVAEIEAAAALPIDPTSSHADRWALELVESLREAFATSQATVASAKGVLDAAKHRLAGLPKPFGVAGWCALVAVCTVCTLAASAAIGALLASSADAYLFRSYLQSILDADAEQVSALFAFSITTACALSFHGTQIVTVLLTRGRLHWGIKVAFIAADVCFAGGFAVMRLGDEFSWQAVAISVFEFALSLVFTVFVMALTPALRRDAERSEPFRVAAAEVRTAEAAHRAALGDADNAEQRLFEQMQTIEKREDAVRRAPRFAALATRTVPAAYAVALSQLVGNEARNESERSLTEAIESHLAAEFADELDRRKAA